MKLRTGEVNPNEAFFVFLDSSFSPLFLSLLSVFLTASILSSADTELFLSAILLSKLVSRGKMVTKKLNKIIMWGLMAVIVPTSIVFTNLVGIYFVLLFTLMIIGPVFLMRLFGRGNDTSAFYGMLGSSLILIYLTIVNLLTGLFPLLLLIPVSVGLFVPSDRKISISTAPAR